jgi:membrane associated rhomboid family serine protease
MDTVPGVRGRIRITDVRPAVRRFWRDYPVTVTITGITALVGAAQLFGPEVVSALQRDPGQLRQGQTWRLVTPLFVQPDGLLQYAFNLTGSAVVGASVERYFGRRRWLVFYFGAGLLALWLAYWWFPHTLDGGSSDAVAGLIGALTYAMWKWQLRPAWPAFVYAAFFAADVTALAAGGSIVAAIVGNTVLVLLFHLRRWPPLRLLVVIEILGLGVILAATRDSHGVGLLTGFLLAAGLDLWGPHAGPEADDVTRGRAESA